MSEYCQHPGCNKRTREWDQFGTKGDRFCVWHEAQAKAMLKRAKLPNGQPYLQPLPEDGYSDRMMPLAGN